MEVLNSYVYRHIRPDTNEPFYIGVGTYHKKWKYGRSLTTKGRNNYWKRIVALNNGKFKVEIIFDQITKQQAIEKEIEFIKLYGRRNLKSGTLCNLTDGGDGIMGPSEETKKKIGDANRGKPNKMKGKKASPELIEKRRQGLIGRMLSEEHKNKISIKRKGAIRLESSNKKAAASNRGRNRSKEFCELMKKRALEQSEQRRERSLKQWAERKAKGFNILKN